MLRRSFDPRRILLFGALVRSYQDRLALRGKFLLWAVLILGVMGLDSLLTSIFVLFSIAFALLMVSSAWGLRPPPRVDFSGGVPLRATAGRPVEFRVGVTPKEGARYEDLCLSLPAVQALRFEPAEQSLGAESGKTTSVKATLTAPKRGRYELRGARVFRTDPFGLVGTRAASQPNDVLLVYPRFYSMERFDIPLGRRYQPGGIPLSSHTGDSLEFLGTREYREGDPIRNIHWRSWARRGAPVVKEYQEEYFCRIAIILDTFPGKPAREEGFEASISVVASIADFFSRSEYVVDILAAGPDIYEVSAGRSLAYLENILDVLACLEPCADPPFEKIGPPLFERLAQLTTVVAVLQDWDDSRLAFLRNVRNSGTAVRAIIVRKGPTTLDWRGAAEEIGEITQMAPDEVESALQGGA